MSERLHTMILAGIVISALLLSVSATYYRVAVIEAVPLVETGL